MSNIPSVEAINPNDKPRYSAISSVFEKRFGTSPDFLVRAPGRANIIGDHIDYSYYSVLPMAIENNIIMAIQTTDEPKITVHNLDPQFKETSFSIENNTTEIDSTKLEWANYFKAGFTIASRHLDQTSNKEQRKGLNVVVSGNVPAGGGLSSSAAFVVSSTLVTLAANGKTEISKVLLTQLSMTCEQLLGMNTGGMDQAASIFGMINHCLLISFKPELKAEPMAYPELDEQFSFLVANSCVPAIKHETAPIGYNLRVVEVSAAANVLAKKLGLEIPQDGNLQCGTLRGVMESHFKSPEVTIERLDEMTELSRKHLSADNYTEQEAAEVLGMSKEDFFNQYLNTFPVKFEKLKLLQRAIHVYQEAKRVLEFCELMNTGTTVAQFGKLLNESHASARDLYQNSHPDVDELCKVALRAGSAGSRVTGAGFGGCTVHMVPKSKVEAVKKAIKEDYYAKKYPSAPEDALLETVPAEGAAIVSASVLQQ